MSKETIIESIMSEWEEYLEMDPDNKWELVAKIVASKLEKQYEETEYYKRIAYAHFSAGS